MTAYSALPDTELCNLLAKDDNKAFEALYQRHAAPLYAYASRKLPVPHLVEDLLQEVFTNLYRNRANLRDIENLRAYLFSAIRYRILNELRNSLLHTQHHQLIQTATTAETEITYDLRLLETQFHEALEKLTERSREIFLLSRRDQLSYKEIADRLGISVKAVEKHMSKSLQVLRYELRDYGFATTAVIILAKHFL
ncbi:RNA polymerase sigma-70 factor [Chitinophaga lutea]